MHTVNALLRAELANALSRMDSAESPPIRQRPNGAPQEHDPAASQGCAALVSEQSPAKASESSTPCTLSPAQSCGPSLSTHMKIAHKPSSIAQHRGLTPARRCDGDQTAQRHAWQTALSGDHASSQPKPVMLGLAPVLLISMTALQLQMERRLKATSPADGSASQDKAADGREWQAQQELEKEAAVAKLQNEHAQQLRALEERLQEQHASTCQHMREAHAQELQALRESLSAEHTSAAASLARQHSQRLASECERITGRLTEEHVKSLEDLREPLQQEHAAAMHALRQQHAQELAESQASIQAELSKQHAAAECALRESLEQAHAASAQQQLTEQAERLSIAHAQAVANLAEEKAAALQALQKQLTEEHVQALASLTEDREAAIKAMREQLSKQHAAMCQHMREAHAQELAAREHQLREEHAHICRDMQAQHAQQVQDMAAEHAQHAEQLKLRMEQDFLEERERIEVEHECQLALVQELAAEHARAQCQGNSSTPFVKPSVSRAFTVSHEILCQEITGQVNFLLSSTCTYAEQAQTSQNRCSELEEQLQAMRSEMSALRKHGAEHVSLQSATPRKVWSCLHPRKPTCYAHARLSMIF